MRDTSIMVIIIFIFVLIGTWLPFINTEFEESASTTDISKFGETLGSEASKGNTDISVLKVLGSIVSMFFWTFGALPLWLDTFFLIFRILFIYTVAKHIRGVSS